MYLVEVHIVDDDYKRRQDSFYTNIVKTLEEAIKYVNNYLYDYVELDDDLERLIESSNRIRDDLIKEYCQTEFTEEPYKIIYKVYEIDADSQLNMTKLLIFQN